MSDKYRSREALDDEMDFLRAQVPDAFPPSGEGRDRIGMITAAWMDGPRQEEFVSDNPEYQPDWWDLSRFEGTNWRIVPQDLLRFHPADLDSQGLREHLRDWATDAARTDEHVVMMRARAKARAANLTARLGTEAFGCYLPWHYFAESKSTPWGIYIYEENLLGLAQLIQDAFSTPQPDFEKCLLLAWHVTYRHELFHYHVERYAIKAEIITRRALYRYYDRSVFQPLHNTEDCLEEALANAVVLGSVLISHRTGMPNTLWRGPVSTLFDGFPPPYSCHRCDKLGGPDAGHRRLAAQITEQNRNPRGDHPLMATPKVEYSADDKMVPGYILATPQFLSQFQLATPKKQLVESFLKRLPARRTEFGKGDHVAWELPTTPPQKVTINYKHNELDVASLKSLAKRLGYTARDLDSMIRKGQKPG